ncbi:MAG: ethanolamine utilization protein [Deltaproteobacteria bacterium]|jgi:ethanolamine utilization protein EutQ|nr:ethanolamine utilization protein [Deltaproteobacteria bacterium]
MPIDKKELEAIVRKVLSEMNFEAPKPSQEPSWKKIDQSGVMAIKLPEVKPEPFDTGKAGDKVFLKDVSQLSESPRLGFGVMEMDQSVFRWTLNYDEVDYIIDGTLEILIDGRKVSAKAGEVIFIPAHTTIEFSSPGFTRFFYVVYPANWYEQ